MWAVRPQPFRTRAKLAIMPLAFSGSSEPGLLILSAFFTLLRGSLVLLVMGLNTLVHGALIVPGALLRFLVPEGRARHAVRTALARVAESWVAVNNFLLSLGRRTTWALDIPATLDHKGCYLVLCNHQSWVDILVLQRCFNRRLPLLRFFLKRQLFWVPVLGLCWWALDFPFMRRASREELQRRPELRGRDLESARRACEIFQDVPVAMMSFPEGTRRAGAKRSRDSGFEHLLKPKAGGAGQVLYALGEQLDGCVDVTVAYEANREPPTFWELVTGRIPSIQVHARVLPPPYELLGRNFVDDLEGREMLKQWMTELWQKKDARISAMQQAR